MIEIIQNRGSGKARALIEAASKTPNSFIITQDKRALKVKAHSYGFDDSNIYDYEDLKNDSFPIGSVAFIHNGDKMLASLLDYYYNIEMVGLTATASPQHKNKGEKKNG